MSSFDDQFWQKTAEHNPYWGVLTHDKYLGTKLDDEVKAEFYATGDKDIDFGVQQIKRHVLGDFRPQRALDFGCGVGRLMLAMSKHAASVYGVDIAPHALDAAHAILTERGVKDFGLSTDIPDGPFDWINSFIVLQHIPPRNGILLIEQLLARLAHGGVVSLHVTIFRDGSILWRGLKESQLGRFNGEHYVNYDRGALSEMPVYEYDLSHVMALMARAGIRQYWMHHTNHGGLHGVWIFARKVAAGLD